MIYMNRMMYIPVLFNVTYTRVNIGISAMTTITNIQRFCMRKILTENKCSLYMSKMSRR